jgi:acyl-CoA reductase-like NAD-dependent aldehyde dehydrogenase
MLSLLLFRASGFITRQQLINKSRSFKFPQQSVQHTLLNRHKSTQTHINMVQGVTIIDGVIQNTNPATGELLSPSVSVTTSTELADVISKANASQESWGNLSLDERIDLLRKGLAAVEPIANELAETITNEMGKVPKEAIAEVEEAIGLKDEWLDLVKEANEDIKLSDGESESIIVRDPLGVVVVISPWNVSMYAEYLMFISIECIYSGHLFCCL